MYYLSLLDIYTFFDSRFSKNPSKQQFLKLYHSLPTWLPTYNFAALDFSIIKLICNDH